MRIWTALCLSGAALCAAQVITPAAKAQSVFYKIFGTGAPPNAVPMAGPRPNAVIPHHRFQSRTVVRPYQSRARQDVNGEDDDVGPPDSGGPYKTMCVRTCDGYYFPVRHNARRKNFGSDAKSCRNACGSDARLFYYSLNGSGGPDSMVDLAGRKYADLPHAFAYRKALVQGCACKRDPWSYEEAARHQSYADQEAIELAKDDAFVKAREAEVHAADPAVKTPDQVAEVMPAEVQAAPERTSAGIQPDGSIDVAAVVHEAANPAEIAAPVVQPPLAGNADRSEPAILPRAPRRRARSYVQRASFKPASAPSGFGKSKYVWPGDAR